MTATEMGRAIAAGRIDAADLAEAFLEAAGRHPDGARVFARLTPERARAEARATRARARAGDLRGPLDGVPVAWKDLFDTAGIATEAGSRLLAGRLPERDAGVLARATLAGTICLGKTRMTEIAWSGLGLNPGEPLPPNALNPAWLPGGSSSGAAASVALGLAPVATGSDTGGSIRIPAAWNGLVGLKATHGRLPMDGVVPLSEDFDTAGPIARTVEDAALLFAAMDGGGAAGLAAGLAGASLSGLRLAVLETVALEECRDAPGAAFEQAAGLLSAGGAAVERLRIPEVAEAADLSALIVTAEAWSIWRDAIAAAPGRMDPALEADLATGAGIAAADYVRNWRILRRCRTGWSRATAGFDAVLMPTSSTLPPDAARAAADADYRRTESRASSRTCRIANQMGLCALTLPTLVPGCGLMIVAPPMAEERLLRIGAAAEATLRAARGG